jgi:hypothetical protein
VSARDLCRNRQYQSAKRAVSMKWCEYMQLSDRLEIVAQSAPCEVEFRVFRICNWHVEISAPEHHRYRIPSDFEAKQFLWVNADDEHKQEVGGNLLGGSLRFIHDFFRRKIW